MIKRFFASCVLALSLLAPAFSAEVGALKVETMGTKGPAVILIPGLSSGPWVWRDTAPRLAKDHRVYLLTLPGFDGRAPQAGVTFDSLQSDLLALIEKDRLGKPVLVGHSLGGSLALAFAADHSDRIRGVVAVDGLPVFPGTENAPDRKALADGTRAQFGGQSSEQYLAGQRRGSRSRAREHDRAAQGRPWGAHVKVFAVEEPWSGLKLVRRKELRTVPRPR